MKNLLIKFCYWVTNVPRITIALFFAFIFFICSCNTVHRFNVIKEKHPEWIANECSDKFTKEILRTDTLTVFADSLLLFECPDEGTINDYFGKDTVQVRSTVTKKIPYYVQSKTVYITKYKEDSAKIFLLSKRNIDLVADNQKKDKKINGQKDWILILVITIAALAIGNIIQIKRG